MICTLIGARDEADYIQNGAQLNCVVLHVLLWHLFAFFAIFATNIHSIAINLSKKKKNWTRTQNYRSTEQSTRRR